tara:strand:- start:1403 stop:2908 length:1506 start_codon:yes stop_codon:yes gene_type:complete
MTKNLPDELFILEMANNHMGSLDHGLRIIRTFGKICKKYPFGFAFKLQYRDLDSFVHPDMKGRDDVHYIKRFSETRLTRKDFDSLIGEIRKHDFLTIVTPFDEKSVDVIESQGIDIIKVASCSFGDWPLLERIIKSDKPIIASTAGASIDTIEQVVSFFCNRKKEFSILHCVGEYPTPDESMHISQIDFLKSRFPGVRIGFSTHEDPSNIDFIKMAIAKGATIFEKHVAVPTEKYGVNKYSATPFQIEAWLEAALYAKQVCGEALKRLPTNQKEAASIQSLRRGVFSKYKLKKGSILTADDVYFAFPPQENQFTANDWSKYNEYELTEDISINSAISPRNCLQRKKQEKVWAIVRKGRELIKKSRVVVPACTELIISHHYGLDKFYDHGLLSLVLVNRDYCKKLLITLPGQAHPEQYHKKKEETFHVLYGELELVLDGLPQKCLPGHVVTVNQGVRHSWSSQTGAVIEEISSTHFADDSFYTDETIMLNKLRKTVLTYWME